MAERYAKGLLVGCRKTFGRSFRGFCQARVALRSRWTWRRTGIDEYDRKPARGASGPLRRCLGAGSLRSGGLVDWKSFHEGVGAIVGGPGLEDVEPRRTRAGSDERRCSTGSMRRGTRHSRTRRSGRFSSLGHNYRGADRRAVSTRGTKLGNLAASSSRGATSPRTIRLGLRSAMWTGPQLRSSNRWCCVGTMVMCGKSSRVRNGSQ